MEDTSTKLESDFNFQSDNLDGIGFDESQTTQLATRRFTGRRGRVPYGKRGATRSRQPRPIASLHNESSLGQTVDSMDFEDVQSESLAAPDPRSRRKVQRHRSSLSFGIGALHIQDSSSEATPGKASSLSTMSTKSSSSRNTENLHPNHNEQGLSFKANSASTCFSSLSRSSSVGLSQRSSFNNSSGPGLSHQESSSTGASSTNSYLSPKASSRKRGVCESPAIHPDELSNNGGISITRTSTSSFGTRRSRSRIFSPQATKNIMESSVVNLDAYESLPFFPDTERPDDNICDSDTDVNDTSNILSTSIDLDTSQELSGNELDTSVEVDRPPLQVKRTSSIASRFENDIFPPINLKDGKTGHQQVFEEMSSYDDLKFLIRQLRAWKNGTQAMVSRFCTVVPPSKWKHERKTKFNNWLTSSLGFSLRSGGGGVLYLQTNKTNASKVHKELEDAMLSYKTKSKDNFTRPKLERKSTCPPEFPISSVKIARSPSIPMLRGRSLTSPSVFPSFRSRRARSMTLDNPSQMNQSVGDIAQKLEHTHLEQIWIDLKTEAEPKREENFESTPFQRTVTMDVNSDLAPGRPSHDCSVNAGDYLNNLHMEGVGLTPRANTETLSAPLPSFSNNKTPVGFSIMSPCVRQNQILSLDDNDCMETPMPRSSMNWGSRPVSGKDWGASKKCDPTIIEILISKYRSRLGKSTSFVCETHVDKRNSEHLSSRGSKEIALVRADSIQLGFDQEADDNSVATNVPNLNTILSQEEMEEDEDSFCAMDDAEIDKPSKFNKRREKSMAKRTRMSICESSLSSPRPFRLSSVRKKSTFASDFQIKLNVERMQTLDESLTSNISSFTEQEKTVDDSLLFANMDQNILLQVFSYLTEYELLTSSSVVCTSWADAATDAHASLMLLSVGCNSSFVYDNQGENSFDTEDEDQDEVEDTSSRSIMISMQRPWKYLASRFPWGMFLSEGAFKRVYKVWNSNVNANEAVSVMNVDQIDNVNVVGSELAVSVMLSSMARRNICPNFVLVRGVFTSEYEPDDLWGSEDNKRPNGAHFDATCKYKMPKKPSNEEKGSFQYIRMELCREGDAEEYIKRQPGATLPLEDARSLLFQMAFSLHVAGNKFGMKHYDVKLLNFFIDNVNDPSIQESQHPFTVLRYGLGSHVFHLKMKTSNAVFAKLADFGTANVRADSIGQPVLIGNFTTLENTPPEYLILGDTATQGYGHDCFGLGLCMLHLFTGHAPYEEILETVLCPKNLKKKLKTIWENKKTTGYEVVRNVILCDVFEDEDGNVLEGEPDDTLYDTLYRFLVLFGIPSEKFNMKEGNRVWRALEMCLSPPQYSAPSRRSGRNASSQNATSGGLDFEQYQKDCEAFSIHFGSNQYIARARENLQKINGGMDLLLSLVNFDPKKRESPLGVLNSTFMESLRVGYGAADISEGDIVRSYMSYSLR